MPKGVPNKRYALEFKKLVVETMQKEKLSYRETARPFEISNHHIIQVWKQIYLAEEPDACGHARMHVCMHGRRRGFGRFKKRYAFFGIRFHCRRKETD